jgi:hypothetical protein
MESVRRFESKRLRLRQIAEGRTLEAESRKLKAESQKLKVAAPSAAFTFYLFPFTFQL